MAFNLFRENLVRFELFVQISNIGCIAEKLIVSKYSEILHLGLGNMVACKDCNYFTADKRNLYKHIKRVHDNIKDLECDEYLFDQFGKRLKCEYATCDKGSLKRHIKAIHQQIKDQKCDYCDYCSSDKVEVNRHIRTKHTKYIKNKSKSFNVYNDKYNSIYSSK